MILLRIRFVVDERPFDSVNNGNAGFTLVGLFNVRKREFDMGEYFDLPLIANDLSLSVDMDLGHSLFKSSNRVFEAGKMIRFGFQTIEFISFT